MPRRLMTAPWSSHGISEKVLLALKDSDGILPSLGFLEGEHSEGVGLTPEVPSELFGVGGPFGGLACKEL